MGEFAGAEFYGDDSKECGRCGMKEKKGGCCHDDHKFIKLEDSHKKAVNDISFQLPEIIVSNEYALCHWYLPAAIEHSTLHNNSPPGYLPRPARIMHGVLRI